MKRPLLGITVAFFTGILLEETLSIPVFYLFLAALITAFLSVLFLQSRLKFSACILIAFLFTGGLCLKNYNTSPAGDIKNLVLFQQGMPSQVILKGVIANRPYSRKTHNLQDKTDFLLDVKALMTSDAWRQSSGTVLANVFNPAVTLRYGDEVILEGELSRPRAATNPGQFDYKKFLEREKIFYCLTVKKENFYKIIGYKGGPLKRFVYAIKARIEALIAEFSPQMEGAFLNTVLLGNRQDMDDDVNDDFVKTGTVHILSISGLHVALMAAILMLALKILRLPFGARAVLLAGMVAMYCVMVDSKPPVMRSAIMIIIFLAGRLLKREQDMLSTLSFSALAILLFDPNDIFNIGFQLSFLTVGAIVYVAPHLKHDPGNKIRSYFFQTTAVSFAAWLASAPLVARYFNIVSPVTVLANIFVVPWVFFVMAVSFVFIIFGSVSHALALVFSQVTNLSITVLIKMVSVFSQIPLACFRVKSPPWVFVIGFYLFVFLFLNRARLKLKAKYFLIGALLLSNIFIWHRALLKPPSELKITFLDVGKGDSMFLEFPGGGTMLIDGGEGLAPDMGRLVVNRFLSYNGINCIDAVCATHPHTDHIGGIVNVLRNFKVRYFMDNADSEENPLYAEARRLLEVKKIKTIVLKEGDMIGGFDSVKLRVLNPPADKKFSIPNDNSLVIRLDKGNFSALLCGDIMNEAAKNLLLTENENLGSIFLKVPHHGGSMGDIAGDFLMKINPKAALISARGKKVDSHILLILKELGTKIYSTDINGAVSLETENNNWRIRQFIQN